MNLVEYTRMYEAEEHHWWYVGLHRLIMAAVQRESHRLGRLLTIFDAGCGTGRLCQLLAAEGHCVSGCDVSEEALRFCRLRGINTTFPADLNSIELEPESYDVVTSIDVLYHRGVSDDVDVMRRLQQGLKPGGLLILNLVAHEFLRSTHDIAVHTRERYTRQMLCERLQSAGFDVEMTTYRVSLLFPFIAAYRLLSRLAVPRMTDPDNVDSDVSVPNQVINSLLLKVVELENLFLAVSSLPFGSSVFVVARKSRNNLVMA
ncbi:MAG: class I SAM-dependent methyltransferase [Desulfuromonadaceae bacterium]|nr:class I SAM-dependent methyltransferase [Desulfuromonadaceae bacterium]